MVFGVLIIILNIILMVFLFLNERGIIKFKQVETTPTAQTSQPQNDLDILSEPLSFPE